LPGIFTQYWKNATWESHGNTDLVFTASNEFRKLGIKSGDKIFIVTNIRGTLHLGGQLTVLKLVDAQEARKLYGKDVWKAADYAVGTSPTLFNINRPIPPTITRALRFGDDKPLVFTRQGRLDQQTIRGVRRLKPASAKLLDSLLHASSVTKSQVSQGSKALRSDREDPAAAAELFDAMFASFSARDRRRWESFLANCVNYVGENFPNHWALALHGKYIRLNVGMVLCVQFHSEYGATILIDKKRTPSGIGKLAGKYRYSPGCASALVPFADAGKTITRIIKPSRLAIDICAASHGGNGAFRGAHSPGVLRYLESRLSITLPDPNYTKNSQHDSRREEKELAKDLALANRPDLAATDKEALRKYRCAQGIFRDRVAALEPRCRISGVAVRSLLTASHIKPWKNSTNRERQDGNNGLFLAPHVDRLFDRGMISFSDNGDILVSLKCEKSVLEAWGISTTANVGPFREEQKKYLAYHRKKFRF
jgi:hypothetical protein